MNLNTILKRLVEGEGISIMYNYGYLISPHSIRRCIRLTQEEKMLLLELYSLYNEEIGYAFPTQQTLGLYLGVTSSTVSRSLHRLEEKGFITSKGKKGYKKRYYPCLNIVNNPYLVLSEVFHFGIRTINVILPNELGSEWANDLLRIINVKKSEEFSIKDTYGELLKNYSKDPEGSRMALLRFLTDYVEEQIDVCLNIDWNEKIINSKKKRKSSISFSQKNMLNNKKSNIVTAGMDDAWIRKLQEED